jgi:hypothetical protein
MEKLDGYPGRLRTKVAAKLLLLTMVRKRELISAPFTTMVGRLHRQAGERRGAP